MKAIDDGVREIRDLYARFQLFPPPEGLVKAALRSIVQAAIREALDADNRRG